MNTELMEQLARAVEQAPKSKEAWDVVRAEDQAALEKRFVDNDVPHPSFDMFTWGGTYYDDETQSCNTVCCLAGFACWLNRKEACRYPHDSIYTVASNLLELTDSQAGSLFNPDISARYYRAINNNPSLAATAIRKMVKDPDISPSDLWSHVRPAFP